MVTAITLLNVSRDRVRAIAEELANIEHVSEVYSVAGRYDLVAIVRTKDNEGLEELITEHMLEVEGVQKSETLIALRGYSRGDLDSVFSVWTKEIAFRYP
jgi:DNA-binding Lrp family transcriptional regulator